MTPLKSKDIRLSKSEKSFFSFFIKNTRVAFLTTFMLFIIGFMGMFSIPKETAPEIDYGIVIISTFFDGASPKDMDALITQEIENKIKDITGINKISSTSKNSFSSIVLEFSPDTNMIRAMSDIRSKIDEVSLPDGSETPKIQEINSESQRNLFRVHLSGDIHPALLKDYGERLKTYIESLPNIRTVNISGGAERRIFVNLLPEKLNEFGINAFEVVNALREGNKDFPLGEKEISSFTYSLRMTGKYKNAEDVKNTLVTAKRNNGEISFIRVQDLAEIEESSEEINTFEYISLKGEPERKQNIKLTVSKTKQSDILKTDPIIRQYIKDFVKTEFGETVRLHFTFEEILFVKKSYSLVLSSGLQSIGIVFLILLLFLGLKEAVTASLIIPLSFMATIAIIYASGTPLNFLMNFSMILSLGILVDTSIVIVEGIHDALKLGYTPKESALIAVEEFKRPLISGTLTTLAVFLPLVTLPGILGKYMSYIPITVSLILSLSLIASLLLIPALAVHLMKPHTEETAPTKNPFSKLFQFLFSFVKKYNTWHHTVFLPKIQRKYKNFILWSVPQKKFRFFIFYGIIFGLFLTFFLPVSFVLFPDEDIDYFQVRVELPEGSLEEQTQKATREVENLLFKKVPEIIAIETSITDDIGNIFVILERDDIRKEQNMRTSIEITEQLRKESKQFRNYSVEVQEFGNGPPSEHAVAFRIIAKNSDFLSQAQKVANDCKEILKNISGTDNVKDDVVLIPGEIKYHLQREKALEFGIIPQTIPSVIRTALSGIEATTITKGSRETDIFVRYHPEKITTLDDIDNIQMITSQGNLISLSQVTEKELQSSLSEIKRRNRNLSITVSSDLTQEGNALKITQEFLKQIENYEFPEGISLEIAGENEENQELFIAMLFGAIIAVILIFSILVIQFDSFKYPFLIVFTIVMSQLGVNIGLFLTETPRSLAFIIGAISLGGIVVNDAIILIDKINNQRAVSPEKDLIPLIANSGASRLQPIVLTTLTTVAGVFPLMLAGTFWQSLAVTIMFGLFFASSLTLLVTPALYYQFDKNLWELLKPGIKVLSVFIGIGIIVGMIG
jgi:HAE1 family hydrophobic/amphiphilic exporter-1